MNKLIIELQRLYFLHDQQWHGPQLDDSGEPVCLAAGRLTPELVAESLAGEKTTMLEMVSADGMARAMVVNFSKPADWEAVANLYRLVQDDLDLPAPAISVSGRKGYRIWFSLGEPVPAAQATEFLDALCRRYLADIPAGNVEFAPDTNQAAAGKQAVVKLVPALHMSSGKWSAFIDPSLGAMFIDEPGLEMAPNMDRQANILAGLESVKAADFQRALGILQQAAEAEATTAPVAPEASANLPDEAASQPCLDTGRRRAKLNVGEHFSDPQSFLLAVMNDPSASARQRIKAAKALLPYFAKEA
jgi:hypothetical protein